MEVDRVHPELNEKYIKSNKRTFIANDDKKGAAYANNVYPRYLMTFDEGKKMLPKSMDKLKMKDISTSVENVLKQEMKYYNNLQVLNRIHNSMPKNYDTKNHILYNIDNANKFTSEILSFLVGDYRNYTKEGFAILTQNIILTLLANSKTFKEKLLKAIYFVKQNSNTEGATAGNVSNIYVNTPGGSFKIDAYEEERYNNRKLIIADDFIVKETKLIPYEDNTIYINTLQSMVGPNYPNEYALYLSDPFYEIFISTLVDILYDKGMMVHVNRFYGMFIGTDEKKTKLGYNYYLMSSSASIEFNQFLESHPKPIDGKMARFYYHFMQMTIFQVLYSCYIIKTKLGYLHCDIHLRNIMFSYVKDTYLSVFGMAHNYKKLRQYYQTRNLENIQYLLYEFTDKNGDVKRMIIENSGLIMKVIDFGRGILYKKRSEYLKGVNNNIIDKEVNYVYYYPIEDEYFSTFDINIFLNNFIVNLMVKYNYQDFYENMARAGKIPFSREINQTNPGLSYDELFNSVGDGIAIFHFNDIQGKPKTVSYVGPYNYFDPNYTKHNSKINVYLQQMDKLLLSEVISLIRLGYPKVEYYDTVKNGVPVFEDFKTREFPNIPGIYSTERHYKMQYYDKKGATYERVIPKESEFLENFLAFVQESQNNPGYHYITLSGDDPPSISLIPPTNILTFSSHDTGVTTPLEKYIKDLSTYSNFGCSQVQDERCSTIIQDIVKTNPINRLENESFSDSYDEIPPASVLDKNGLIKTFNDRYRIYTSNLFELYRIQLNNVSHPYGAEEFYLPTVYNIFFLKHYEYTSFSATVPERLKSYLTVTTRGNDFKNEAHHSVAVIRDREMILYFYEMKFTIGLQGNVYSMNIEVKPNDVINDADISFYTLPLYISTKLTTNVGPDVNQNLKNSMLTSYKKYKEKKNGETVVMNFLAYKLKYGLFIMSVEDESLGRDFNHIYSLLIDTLQFDILYLIDISTNDTQVAYYTKGSYRYIYEANIIPDRKLLIIGE